MWNKINSMEKKYQYFLIQKNDEKSQLWAQETTNLDFKINIISKSPVLTPFFLIASFVQKGRAKGVIFRYLND